MTELTQYIPDEGTMLRFGKKLAEVLVKQPKDNAIVLYFNGDLGAWKTTLTRGMVQGLGYQGNVKSPTYTLVEEYSIAGKMIYHFVYIVLPSSGMYWVNSVIIRVIF